MTPEDLDATLRALEDHAPRDVVALVRHHIAALERGRGAALADNAALVLLWKERGCLDLGPRVDADAPSSCIEQGWPMTERGSCPACRAMAAPHPGAALLKQHRKALVRAKDEGRTQGIREAIVVCNEEGRPELMPCIADLLEEPESD